MALHQKIDTFGLKMLDICDREWGQEDIEIFIHDTAIQTHKVLDFRIPNNFNNHIINKTLNFNALQQL